MKNSPLLYFVWNSFNCSEYMIMKLDLTNWFKIRHQIEFFLLMRIMIVIHPMLPAVPLYQWRIAWHRPAFSVTEGRRSRALPGTWWEAAPGSELFCRSSGPLPSLSVMNWTMINAGKKYDSLTQYCISGIFHVGLIFAEFATSLKSPKIDTAKNKPYFVFNESPWILSHRLLVNESC